MIDPLIQQGPKLTGSGASRRRRFGFEVALSADGNTALVGGPCDNSDVGAAWVFTRSGTTWTQQGAKLTGRGGSGAGVFGFAVALSADGNTALVGGARRQQRRRRGVGVHPLGHDLDAAGSEAHRHRRQRRRAIGFGVALSGDGDTAALGGPATTAARARSGSSRARAATWTQQGAKLTGSGVVGASTFGFGVALSADGNTALVGGPYDNGFVGAAWVFTRSGATWSQQGGKLTGSGESGQRFFGVSVGAVGRRQHGAGRGLGRQRLHRRGLGVHALGHDLDASRAGS